MPILSVVRMKCYLILQGLERSLKDSLFDQYDVEAPSFLTAEEQERSLGRLRQDMEESAWGLDDVRNEDLLPYLDLGDLVALLNRHQALARQVSGDEIGAARRCASRKSYTCHKKAGHACQAALWKKTTYLLL